MLKVERGSCWLFPDFVVEKSLVTELDKIKEQMEKEKGYSVSYQMVIRRLVTKYNENKV